MSRELDLLEVEYVQACKDLVRDRRRGWAFQAARLGGRKLEDASDRFGVGRFDLARAWRARRFAVVFGELGMGKSASLYQMLEDVIEQSDEESRVVPFLASLEEDSSVLSERYASIDEMIWARLPSEVMVDGLRAVFDRALAEGRAALLVDDLPRSPRERAEVVRMANKFLRQHRDDGNRLALAVTPSEFQVDRVSFVDFDQYYLSGLSDEDIVRRILMRNADARGQDVADRLIRAVLDDPDLRDLAAIPSHLSVICAEFDESTGISKSRVLEELLWARAGWERSHRLGHERVAAALDVLSTLALAMKNSDEGALEFSLAELGRQSARVGFDTAEATSPGIIRLASYSRYSFTSELIRDYLAGRALSDALVEGRDQDPWLSTATRPAQTRTTALTLGTATDVRLRLDVALGALETLLGGGASFQRVLLAARAVDRAGSARLVASSAERLGTHLLATPSRDLDVESRIQVARLAARFTEPHESVTQSLRQDVAFIPTGQLHFESSSDSAYPAQLDVWIAKHPVTTLQYQEFVDAEGYGKADYWSEKGWRWLEEENAHRQPVLSSRFVHPTQPVVGLTCYEAEAYCKWLEGRLTELYGTSRYEVRLPTEIEWIAAARGTLDLPQRIEVLPLEDAWRDPRRAETTDTVRNPDPRRSEPWSAPGGDVSEWPLFDLVQDAPPPVGTFPELAGPYGTEELVGSVWQWLSTNWGANWERPVAPLGVDARAELRVTSPDLARMVRGGSYLVSESPGAREVRKHLGVDYRARNYADIRHTTHGFRVSLAPVPGLSTQQDKVA